MGGTVQGNGTGCNGVHTLSLVAIKDVRRSRTLSLSACHSAFDANVSSSARCLVLPHWQSSIEIKNARSIFSPLVQEVILSEEKSHFS